MQTLYKQRSMYWIFLLFASTIKSITANQQCRTEVNIQGMALKRSVFKSCQWRLLTSAMSNVDKRLRAKAITTIENTKYVNWITAPRRRDQRIFFQRPRGFTSGDWTAEVRNQKSMYLAVFVFSVDYLHTQPNLFPLTYD